MTDRSEAVRALALAETKSAEAEVIVADAEARRVAAEQRAIRAEQALETAKAELEVARAFHEVAVKERDHERARANRMEARAELASAALAAAHEREAAAVLRAETAEALLIERRAEPMVRRGAALAERDEPLQLTHPEVPAKPPTLSEGGKRDAALDALACHRAHLVKLAKGIALELSRRNGCVTSAEVLQELRVRGHAAILEGVDSRFMGVVFRRGWKQVGWSRTGSHKRNQPVWAAVRMEP